MRLAIFDYGAGNLHSLSKALQAPDVVVSVETDPRALLSADAIVMPGVGAFGAAAARLAPARAEIATALAGGMPCLGICLGMQLLFDASEESPGSSGLGVIRGQVTRLRAARVPHMSWNAVVWGASGGVGVTLAAKPGTMSDVSAMSDASEARRRIEPDVAYFAHSYACRPADERVVLAWTAEDADRFPSAVRWRNVVGVQFHPEKSSSAGVRFLRAFLGAL
jgi:imidazole glycerol-phosphate synthase subunit HisH